MDVTLEQLTAELQAVKQERDHYKSRLEQLQKDDKEDHSARVRKQISEWKEKLEEEAEYSEHLRATFV